jgi:tetratricopeptide (TPR) repeat protein
MLARMGGRTRELNVAVSVDTSVTAPLMTAGGRRLLALLGILPDGVAHDDLIALLPGSGRSAAAVLRQLGLAFDEGDRIRILSPIREHIAASLQPEHSDLHRAVRHYAQLASDVGGQIGGHDGHQAVIRFQAETGNIAAMLDEAANSGRITLLTSGIHGLIDYWRYTGLLQPEIISMAERAIQADGRPAQQASTYLALGDLALARSDHDNARAHYEHALSLYKRIGDVLGHAHAIKSLGDIGPRRSRYDSAQTRYEQALPLYQQVGDILGQANCIKSQGTIALRQSDCDTAYKYYREAIPLYQQAGSLLGEANCVKSLGDVALKRSQHDMARARYEQALSLYRAITAPYAVGWTHVRLARLATSDRMRSRHWKAAREAWAGIERMDLIASITAGFDKQS